MKAALLLVILALGLASSSPTPASKLSTTVFQAAAYYGASGVSIQNNCDGTLVLTSVNHGDYVYYRGVDFGTVGMEAVEINFSDGNSLGYTGTVSFRLDSVNGPSLADITVGPTNNWCTFYSLTTILRTVPTGVHDVYVTFSGIPTSNLMYFNWFRFIATIT